jgi:hypothetical protein
MTIRYLVIEIVCIICFAVFAHYFIANFGFKGVSLAHVANNIVFLTMVLLVFIFSKFEDKKV